MKREDKLHQTGRARRVARRGITPGLPPRDRGGPGARGLERLLDEIADHPAAAVRRDRDRDSLRPLRLSLLEWWDDVRSGYG